MNPRNPIRNPCFDMCPLVPGDAKLRLCCCDNEQWCAILHTAKMLSEHIIRHSINEIRMYPSSIHHPCYNAHTATWEFVKNNTNVSTRQVGRKIARHSIAARKKLQTQMIHLVQVNRNIARHRLAARKALHKERVYPMGCAMRDEERYTRTHAIVWFVVFV